MTDRTPTAVPPKPEGFSSDVEMFLARRFPSLDNTNIKRMAQVHVPWLLAERDALIERLEEATNPICLCEFGQQADPDCYHHGIGSPDHIAALESCRAGLETAYQNLSADRDHYKAKADALAEALEELRKFARYATDKGVDPGFFQIAIDHADEEILSYREKQ